MRFLGLLLALASLSFVAEDATQNPYFEKKIRPLFASTCIPFHTAKMKAAGLDLETGVGFSSGGRVAQVIGYEERVKMPPSGKLKPDDLSAINEWVKGGGRWPGAVAAAATGSGTRTHGAGIKPEERSF